MAHWNFIKLLSITQKPQNLLKAYVGNNLQLRFEDLASNRRYVVKTGNVTKELWFNTVVFIKLYTTIFNQHS